MKMKRYQHLLFALLLPCLANAQSTPIWFAKPAARPGVSTIAPAVRDTAAATAPAGPFVTFYGSAALSGGSTSSDISSTLTASGKFSLTANPAGNFFLDVGANLLNVNPAKTKKDSVDFNSLMFPEAGNFGVYISPNYRIDISGTATNGFSIVPLYEFAYRKYAVDSPSIAFKIFNHTLGVRAQWHYKPSDANEITIGLTPYKNWFAVSAEDVKNFTGIVNDSAFRQLAINNKALTVGSFGVKLTVQYNTMLFFADFRKNAHTSSLADDDPFKGTVVNIGFATYIKIGSF